MQRSTRFKTLPQQTRRNSARFTTRGGKTRNLRVGSLFAEATSFATCVWRLSAALANGDDTLSITADCYLIAAADAALATALVAAMLGPRSTYRCKYRQKLLR